MNISAVALATLALGCGVEREAESVLLEERANVEMRLVGDGEDQYADRDELTFDWIQVSSPPGSTQELRDDGVDAIATFSTQGRYVLDRWVNYQLTSVWTHRYTVDIVNSIPRAEIQAPMSGEIGVPVQLNATNSVDGDGTPLQYRWSMKFRPGGSASSLAETEAEFIEFVPDQLGAYTIDLTVFDGDAWDESPDVVVIWAR